MSLVRLALLFFLATPLSAQESREKEWNDGVAAAKREATVTVASNADAVIRKEIIPRFNARFGIAVDFIAGSGTQITTRVKTERSAGIYSMDVFLHGSSNTASVLYPEKLIDPLKPLLTLAEVVDPSKWKKGKLWFMDPEEQYALRVFNRLEDFLYINTDYVKAEEFRSAKDLLSPKWRGKMATLDPTASGAGGNRATRFYHQFGEEFVKRLYLEQEPRRTRNRRELADWLARGTYPVCLSCQEEDMRTLRREGFKILTLYALADMPGMIGASPWLLTVANKAPHPNAARVFANWIVSKEGLELYSRATGAATLRNDVDESFLPRDAVPHPGGKYFDSSDWKWVLAEREITERVRSLLQLR